MKIIYKDRGEGKTTDLIKLSYGSPKIGNMMVRNLENYDE